MAIIEVHERCQRQLRDVADAIAEAKRIVIITGAGVSTNCGIPVCYDDPHSYRVFADLQRISVPKVDYILRLKTSMTSGVHRPAVGHLQRLPIRRQTQKAKLYSTR